MNIFSLVLIGDFKNHRYRFGLIEIFYVRSSIPKLVVNFLKVNISKKKKITLKLINQSQANSLNTPNINIPYH